MCNLEVEMQDDDHFSITWLEYGMLDVVVQDVHFIAAHRCETETCQQGEGVTVLPITGNLYKHLTAACKK